jgi:hypothetical protein
VTFYVSVRSRRSNDNLFPIETRRIRNNLAVEVVVIAAVGRLAEEDSMAEGVKE